MKERAGWAWRRTKRLGRDHLVVGIVVAAAGLVIVEVVALYHHKHGVGRRALDGLGLTVAASILVMILGLVWNFAIAGTQIELEHLRLGPEAVEAKRVRLQQVRESIGNTQREVRDLLAKARDVRSKGVFWDYRQPGFELLWFDGSGGQLAGEPRSNKAFTACDVLLREAERINDVAHRRWFEDTTHPLYGVNPNDIVYFPDVKNGELDPLIRLAEKADRELDAAMERLSRPAT